MVKKIVQRVIVGVLVSLILTIIYGAINANALTLTLDAVPTGNSFRPLSFNCKYNPDTWTTNQSVCRLEYSVGNTSLKNIYGIATEQYFDFREGYYYEFLMALEASSNQFVQAMTWYPVVLERDWVLVDYEQLSDERSRDYLRKLNCDSGSTINCDYINVGAYSKLYRVVMKSKTTSNRQFLFGNGQNNLFIFNNQWNDQGAQFEGYAQISIGLITEYESVSAGEQMQQDKAENEAQGEASQNDANSTQQETDQKSQNLLGFLSSFFGAFTSAQATNCNLNWGMAEYGFGQIDMCSTEIPPIFRGVLSVITLLIVLPMIIWLINSIIGAFKEFQE